jgi:hypothetical protein
MSIGFFVRVATYLGDQEATERELSEINRVLREAGLPAYHEPPKEPEGIHNLHGRTHRFGRAWSDHNSASIFAQLGETARQRLGEQATMLPMLLDGHPLYFLPIAFSKALRMEPEPAMYVGGPPYRRHLCSSPRTASELLALAKFLDIASDGQTLSDAAAESINEAGEALPTVWLTTFEAVRLSVVHNCALILG